MSKVYISKKNRLFVKKRAKGCCEYCRSQDDFSTQDFTIDHIIPTVDNGSNKPANLAYSCYGCNRKKWIYTTAFDIHTKRKVPLFNPRTHLWNNHFSWSVDFLEIIGISDIGRATVESLKLNRSGVVNLRMATLILERHPPDF